MKKKRKVGKLYLPILSENTPLSTRAGIDVTYFYKTKEIGISGWYDTCVGIEGAMMPLRDFFEALGITKEDCVECFQEGEAQGIYPNVGGTDAGQPPVSTAATLLAKYSSPANPQRK